MSKDDKLKEKRADLRDKLDKARKRGKVGKAHSLRTRIQRITSRIRKLRRRRKAHPRVVLTRISPNRSERTTGIQLIVLHSTESNNVESSDADLAGVAGWFANPASNVSSHVITDGDGHSARCVEDKDKAWHCFAGDERIVTSEGTRRLGELAGTEPVVLTSRGMQTASVMSFGEQPTQRVVLVPAIERSHWRTGARYWASWGTHERREFVVTPDHEWVLADGGTTRSLAIGDVVSGNVRTPEHECEAFRIGVRDGFVFGDGYFGKATLTRGSRYYAPMHGSKADVGEFFDRVAWWPSRAEREPTYAGTAICSSRRDLKSYPADVDDADYLAGWLRGWLRADAHNNGSSYELTSTDEDALAFAREIAPLAGMTVTGGQPMKATAGYDGGTICGQLTLRDGAIAWKVAEVAPGDDQEVFCAVVPTTGDFTLAGGVLTHNCSSYNSAALGIEQIGRASQTIWAAAELHETARWIARWSKKHNVPIQRAKVSNGRVVAPGVATHSDLGTAGGGHTDPGAGYPVGQVLDLAKDYRKRI